MNNVVKDKLLKLRDKLFAHKNSNKIAENQLIIKVLIILL